MAGRSNHLIPPSSGREGMVSPIGPPTGSAGVGGIGVGIGGGRRSPRMMAMMVGPYDSAASVSSMHTHTSTLHRPVSVRYSPRNHHNLHSSMMASLDRSGTPTSTSPFPPASGPVVATAAAAASAATAANTTNTTNMTTTTNHYYHPPSSSFSSSSSSLFMTSPPPPSSSFFFSPSSHSTASSASSSSSVVYQLPHSQLITTNTTPMSTPFSSSIEYRSMHNNININNNNNSSNTNTNVHINAHPTNNHHHHHMHPPYSFTSTHSNTHYNMDSNHHNRSNATTATDTALPRPRPTIPLMSRPLPEIAEATTEVTTTKTTNHNSNRKMKMRNRKKTKTMTMMIDGIPVTQLRRLVAKHHSYTSSSNHLHQQQHNALFFAQMLYTKTRDRDDALRLAQVYLQHGHARACWNMIEENQLLFVVGGNHSRSRRRRHSNPNASSSTISSTHSNHHCGSSSMMLAWPAVEVAVAALASTQDWSTLSTFLTDLLAEFAQYLLTMLVVPTTTNNASASASASASANAHAHASATNASTTNANAPIISTHHPRPYAAAVGVGVAVGGNDENAVVDTIRADYKSNDSTNGQPPDRDRDSNIHNNNNNNNNNNDSFQSLDHLQHWLDDPEQIIIHHLLATRHRKQEQEDDEQDQDEEDDDDDDDDDDDAEEDACRPHAWEIASRVWFWRGRACWEMGDPTLATTYWSTALRLDAHNQTAFHHIVSLQLLSAQQLYTLIMKEWIFIDPIDNWLKALYLAEIPVTLGITSPATVPTTTTTTRSTTQAAATVTTAASLDDLPPCHVKVQEAFLDLTHTYKLGQSPHVLALAARRAYNCYDWMGCLGFCEQLAAQGAMIPSARASSTLYTISPLNGGTNSSNMISSNNADAAGVLSSSSFATADAAYCYVAVLVLLGHHRSLFALAHEWVAAATKSPQSWFAVGGYYYAMGRFHIAQRHFCRATRLDPSCSPAWMAFGCAFAMVEESDQALASFRAAQRLAPGDAMPLLYMGVEYVRTNHLTLASHFLQSAHRLNQNDPLCLHELGVLEWQLGHSESAIQWFSQALLAIDYNHNTEDQQRDSTFASSSSSSVSSAAAVTAAIQACSDPYWEPTLFNLGHAYRKTRQFTLAMACFQRCVALTQSCSAYAALAFATHLSGRVDSAIALYHQALASKADDPFCSEMLNRALRESMLHGFDDEFMSTTMMMTTTVPMLSRIKKNETHAHVHNPSSSNSSSSSNSMMRSSRKDKYSNPLVTESHPFSLTSLVNDSIIDTNDDNASDQSEDMESDVDMSA